jgi:hypothetical protein
MTQQLTHWKKPRNPDYIGAWDFQPNEEKIVTIKSAAVEKVAGQDGKKEDCVVVRFKEATKPLVCNVTNAKAISKVCGSSYIENWSGVAIQLFTTKVKAFGDETDAVRVRPFAPKVTKPELNPSSTNWLDAKQAIAENKTTVDAIRKHYVLSTENEKLLTS